MNLVRLNKLISRIELLTNHLNENGLDALLEESLLDYQQELKEEYGSFLQDRLFDIYDEYFEDDEILSLENYIGKGSEVYGDEFYKEKVFLNIKSSPVRFEIHDYEDAYCNVLWKAA
ncbi:hypothetical protein [Ekhidna sp.]